MYLETSICRNKWSWHDWADTFYVPAQKNVKRKQRKLNLELNNSNMKKLIKLIIITVLVVFCVFRFDKIYACGTWIIGLLMPFVIGFAIAFILNVPMKGFENLLFRNEKSRWYRFRRPVCMVLSLICVVLVIAFVITMCGQSWWYWSLRQQGWSYIINVLITTAKWCDFGDQPGVYRIKKRNPLCSNHTIVRFYVWLL